LKDTKTELATERAKVADLVGQVDKLLARIGQLTIQGITTPPAAIAPPLGYGLAPPTPLLQLRPDTSVQASMWDEGVKAKVLDEHKAIQVTDPKVPPSLLNKTLYLYDGQTYPSHVLLYSPSGLVVEHIEKSK
jgi:hypothetical protein